MAFYCSHKKAVNQEGAVKYHWNRLGSTTRSQISNLSLENEGDVHCVRQSLGLGPLRGRKQHVASAGAERQGWSHTQSKMTGGHRTGRRWLPLHPEKGLLQWGPAQAGYWLQGQFGLTCHLSICHSANTCLNYCVPEPGGVEMEERVSVQTAQVGRHMMC